MSSGSYQSKVIGSFTVKQLVMKIKKSFMVVITSRRITTWDGFTYSLYFTWYVQAFRLPMASQFLRNQVLFSNTTMIYQWCWPKFMFNYHSLLRSGVFWTTFSPKQAWTFSSSSNFSTTTVTCTYTGQEIDSTPLKHWDLPKNV
jgi:hypothetical protein